METTSGRSESDPSSWPTLDEFKQLSVEGKSAAYGTARTEGFNSQKRLRTLEQHTDARFARLEKTLGHFEVTNAKLQARIEEQDGAIRKQNKTINEQSASIEHLNKINKEQSASISHLNKINKEQSASISHLNKINREQSASIERLKKINKEQSASISHLMERDSINQLTIERQGMSVAAWMSDYTSVRDDNRELNRSMRELTAKYNELKRRVDDLTATS
ncbi:hypothetical protein Poli38472_003727 [Pythium oligandrum]|uniref:Uncharacterized protein n=1 Tax=Pythium oligandrum TaxID=41045 RepID=A0A8K1CLZ0_PYTOL|nr:hypothetical protein Poli38472_003727 [Pythium oligandrum]|eukprot:TMW65962.1 hypothetical protein Poli38472_003727 [Pythium oligandrum]